MAGLEALDYWTHLCDCARRKTDARLFVSNEYLSFRFGCIIELGLFMNKHTLMLTFHLGFSQMSKGGYPLASFLAQVQCLTVSVKAVSRVV